MSAKRDFAHGGRKDSRFRRDATRDGFDRHPKVPSSREPGPPGLFHIHGRRPVLEALRKSFVESIEIVTSAHGQVIEEIVQLAAERHVPLRRVSEVPAPEDVVTQGVLATARPPEIRGDLRPYVEHLAQFPSPLILILDGITDPHNFGAILRSADCAGVTAVIIRDRRQAPVTDAVVKASAGAAYLLPIFQVPNLAQAVKMLKEAGLWVIAASGEKNDVSAWEFDWKRSVALIVGAEGEGVSSLLRRDADECVKIPMFGQIESLNVSVATGVLLFEIARKRHESS